jgi:hypothetical protein
MLANEIALNIYGFVDIIIGSFLQTFKKQKKFLSFKTQGNN